MLAKFRFSDNVASGSVPKKETTNNYVILAATPYGDDLRWFSRLCDAAAPQTAPAPQTASVLDKSIQNTRKRSHSTPR